MKKTWLWHLLHCTRHALRHPRIALKGVKEFRSDLTTHYEDLAKLESYDSGRELAHMFTLRRFEAY